MAASMKLYYDKRLKDPTYYIQQGFRNGKKTTTKNIKRLGKHSELLLITDDPLEYAKNEVKKMNEEYRSGRSEFVVTMDFNERIPSSDSPCSNSTSLNIGYLYLKDIYAKLNLSDFFKSVSSDRKITYDCNKICQFLTYARILDPASKYGTYDKLDTYYEKPQVEYQHMIRFLDILDRNSDKYLKHLFDNSENIFKRETISLKQKSLMRRLLTKLLEKLSLDFVSSESVRKTRHLLLLKWGLSWTAVESLFLCVFIQETQMNSLLLFHLKKKL